MEIVLLWVGIPFTFIGALILLDEVKTRRTFQKTRGTVVGYSSGLKNRRTSLFPVVKFRGLDGGDYLVVGSTGSSVPLYEIGEVIGVYVKSATEARVASALNFIFGGVFGGIGLFTSILFFFVFKPSVFTIAIAAVVSIVVLFKVSKVLGQVKSHMTEVKSAWRKGFQDKVYKDSDSNQISWAPSSEVMSRAQIQRKSSAVSIPILVVIAVACLCGGVYFYKKTSRFLATAQPATGAVIDMIMSRGNKGGSSWAPMVEFSIAPNSVPVRFKHMISSNPPAYHIGDRVPVLYNPLNPQEAQIDMGVWNYLATVIFGGVSGLFAILTLASLRHRNRRRTMIPIVDNKYKQSA